MPYSNNKFLIDYFKKGIYSSNNNIAHCILFWGNNINKQYELATEIARLLNCKTDGNENCNCINCNWIKENTHPAVLTYTRKDNKSSDDDTKNVISISQARKIKTDLAVTSEYHRVIIFCDRDDNGNLQALNHINFPSDAANALLKTFEEPPSNTTFFFLTKDSSDIISTIVSRSQCFFVPSQNEEPQDYDLVKDIMQDYFEIAKDDVLDFNENIYNLAKENGTEIVLTQIQNYLINVLKSNLNNKSLKIKILSDINHIEKAKKELRVGMQEQTIIEALSYNLIL